MSTHRRNNSSGFTIVEAAVSVAIVGVLLVSSTAVFSTIARSRASQNESRLAQLLAQQLMAEIIQSAYAQSGTTPPFGPQSGQTRATYPAVDCYDGYVASPPVSELGTTLSDYAGWTEKASVAFVDPLNPTVAAATSSLKQITVTIVAPGGKNYSLVGWRSKFGAYEVPPLTQTTFVTGVAVTVQGAAPTKTVYSGAHPLNIATSQ
ncbi:MAG: biosis protein MshD [Phycisphaerales bacterium]|nr:biosis protein MshD [Phycisphaerales bacterium]